MNKNQIAKKYSRAIVSSVEISEIPVVIEELKAFSDLIDKNKQLKQLFAGQIFAEDEKSTALDALAPLLKFNANTEKFLKLIIVHGHISAIKEMITATIDVYNEKQKKATAIVISSVELSAKYNKRLKGALEKMTDREVTVENEIDDSLVGGFVVKMGSTIFDSSVKGQLRLLRAELLR